jgi:hypothetical protein
MAANQFEQARVAFVAADTVLDELAASLTDEQHLLASCCRGWAERGALGPLAARFPLFG